MQNDDHKMHDMHLFQMHNIQHAWNAGIITCITWHDNHDIAWYAYHTYHAQSNTCMMHVLKHAHHATDASHACHAWMHYVICLTCWSLKPLQVWVSFCMICIRFVIKFMHGSACIMHVMMQTFDASRMSCKLCISEFFNIMQDIHIHTMHVIVHYMYASCMSCIISPMNYSCYKACFSRN